jgi:hypothetical protein
MALVLLVAATACSTIEGHHWRKTTGSTFVVVVSLPSTNPHSPELNNQEPWFADAVEEAVFQWDSHPDLTVIYQYEDPGVRTCDFFRANPDLDWNCVEAWMVSQTHINTHVNGAAGLAFRLVDAVHYFNGNVNSPARIEVVNDWSTQPAGSRENAVCHEIGHMLGLNHAIPIDHDSDPETPDFQPPGPCQGAVPDKDLEAPYDQNGFDWQNIDIIYDTCHNDTTGPTGANTGTDDLSSGGYDSCGAARLAPQEDVMTMLEEAVAEARDRQQRRVPAQPYPEDMELQVVVD